jgi:tol-pal system protein YbgF
MNKLKTGIVLGLLLSLSSVYAEISPETAVNIFQRLEVLEKKTRELNGENEVLKHQISQLKKSQKQGFLSVDERFDKLANTEKSEPESKKDGAKDKDAKVKIIESSDTTDEPKNPKDEKVIQTVTPTAPEAKPAEQAAKADSASSTAAVSSITSTRSVTPNKKIRAPNSYERETYQAAFSLMKKSPSAATKAFQEYIKMQPESPLAANAQYWIGEVMYSHNNYKGAVQEFIKVLQKYKYSDKAPDAAIKLGYSFYALKNWTYARRTFDDVIKYFPENKNAVNLAQRRLAKMTAAGN